MKTILLIFTLFSALMLGACQTVRVSVPKGATIEPGGIRLETQFAVWKSNAEAGTGDAAVEATTSPTTDASLTGL